MNTEAITKTLTEKQARELALAIIGIEPSLKLYDRSGQDESFTIHYIESIAEAGQFGIEFEFTFGIKPKSIGDWSDADLTKYRLQIDYWDMIHNRNPALLGLFHYTVVDPAAPIEVETVANITVVTDLLREWNIW